MSDKKDEVELLQKLAFDHFIHNLKRPESTTVDQLPVKLKVATIITLIGTLFVSSFWIFNKWDQVQDDLKEKTRQIKVLEIDNAELKSRIKSLEQQYSNDRPSMRMVEKLWCSKYPDECRFLNKN